MRPAIIRLPELTLQWPMSRWGVRDIPRVRLFWSDLIVSVRNCSASICGGGRGMAGVLQPAITCSNSSRDRPNTPAASLLLLRIPLAPLLSHVLVSTPTNVAGRSPSNDQVRHKTPGHTRRRPHSRGAAPKSPGTGERPPPPSQTPPSGGCPPPGPRRHSPAGTSRRRSPRAAPRRPGTPRSNWLRPAAPPGTAAPRGRRPPGGPGDRPRERP